MPTLPWSQVASSDQYKKLSPDMQQQAQQQYFRDVVVPADPRLQDPQMQAAVYKQFMNYAQSGGQPQGGGAPSGGGMPMGGGAPAPGTGATSQADGSVSYAPSAMAQRGAQGLMQGVPFAEAGLRKVTGGQAYPGGAPQALGDVGLTAADIAAGIETGGVLPALKFAGLSAALNAAGIPQKAAQLGQGTENALDTQFEHNYPSKVHGIEGLGTALDFAQRIPGAAADVGIEALPYWLAGKTAAGAETPRGGEAPPPTPQQLLEKFGGTTTPAMSGNKLMRGMASGVERATSTNPLLSWLPEKVQSGNVAAIQKYLESIFGPEAVNERPEVYGSRLGQTLSDFNAQRGQQMAEAEQALRSMPPNLPVKPGMLAANRIYNMLIKAGVPIDERGLHPEAMTGNEGMDQQTAQGLYNTARQVSSAKTLGDLLNQRRNFDASGIPNFDVPPDAMQRLQNMARGHINDALSEALSASGNKPLMDQWKAANAKYADTADLMNKVKAGQIDELRDQDVFGKILSNPATGGPSLQKLKANMPPEMWKQVQQGVVNRILSGAQDAQQGGALSLQKLNTALQTYAPVIQRLDPEMQAGLHNAAKMMDLAKLNDLRRINPSGTAGAASNLLHTGALFDALTGGPASHAAAAGLIGENALEGGYYGGNALAKMMGKGVRAGAQMAKEPIPGTPELPLKSTQQALGVPDLIARAMGRGVKGVLQSEKGSILPDNSEDPDMERSRGPNWRSRGTERTPNPKVPSGTVEALEKQFKEARNRQPPSETPEEKATRETANMAWQHRLAEAERAKSGRRSK
ncbi:hypothetical protein KGP36_02545 [Patescibacteria group bacterium]|nr:hypothetical protein [Patescibacteria group bacterium]